MTEKHLSSQFDDDLTHVSSSLMKMGGIVEAQVQRAISALAGFSVTIAQEVIGQEEQVDVLEVEIDRALTTVVARRQPAARDLRFLLAMSKITTNLERAGDEAHKVAKRVISIVESGEARQMPIGDLRVAAEMASSLIHRALDAFARLDVAEALGICREDDLIDREFKGFTRKLVTFMMEDPHTISTSLDLLFIAKAIERIGDHAKNIAEFIIYIVKGMDVRHSALAQVEANL
ncbi:MAG: phosphate signaling complex protein PhoU [Zoogloeaceae bacterium]|jgi:phosphate transport system protein|nr:phosphate signaling complex protein PhoU [Zoogloeaceae bacterium]